MAKNPKQSGLNFGKSDTTAQVPVECLGMKFPNDDARRAHFTEILRKKLKDPAFRKIEGFPIGSDEDILALSDPPYYTACPNPFIEEFISTFAAAHLKESDDYSCPPFATDVSEGKYHPFYKLHPYPTKVPHQAIMRYVLHYTKPGDVILDGFCGTGMAGVAAQFCDDPEAIRSLGYTVDQQGNVLDEQGITISKVGVRAAILNDLGVASAFVAYNYNLPIDAASFSEKANPVLSAVKEECDWMYRTLHNPKPAQVSAAITTLDQGNDRSHLKLSGVVWGDINYTVLSDVFICPHCATEVVFWNVAVDKEAGKIRDSFSCLQCNASLTKQGIERAWETRMDRVLGKPIRQGKQVPVLINYSVGTQRHIKAPDLFDITLLSRINDLDIANQPPPYAMPKGFNTEQPKVSHGFTHAHHFYSPRNYWCLAAFSRQLDRRMLGFTITKVAGQVTHLYRFTHQSGVWGAGGGPLSGTLYVPSLVKELSICNQLEQAIADQVKIRAVKRPKQFAISTSSSTQLLMQDNSVDYIFVDPPFGGNLMYSELLYLSETWLRILTNNACEAIVNAVQKKGFAEYEGLMTRCFREFSRVLKPGRWITVEFHNSQNAVWAAIQESLQRVGFVVADVRTLDKKKKTIKQTTGAGAVNQDLIISAYKPSDALVERFGFSAGTAAGCWEFVETHLRQLPVFVCKVGKGEIVAERQNYLLFDRMVAFHVERGSSVPFSAAEFYGGLRQRYPERDGMYFLPGQVSEYDRKRLEVREVEQYELFVSDEKSAIQWVRRQLTGKPISYQELQPLYMKEAQRVWEKHEQPLELLTILEQNFVEDSKDKWSVPDPDNEVHLEQLRHRALMKEFQQYREVKGKLKLVRTEALRAGFKECWQKKDYTAIVEMAKRVPDAVIQEDPALLMYFDNASLLQGE